MYTYLKLRVVELYQWRVEGNILEQFLLQNCPPATEYLEPPST